jgi:hypothetical protein
MENAYPPLFDVVDALLKPLPGDEPTGTSARYDPVIAEIRIARESDDPSLPQGEWERPLKKADWSLVASLCIQTLSERSKDLQIAAWLSEAWIHQHQVDGQSNSELHKLQGSHFQDCGFYNHQGICRRRIWLCRLCLCKCQCISYRHFPDHQRYLVFKK